MAEIGKIQTTSTTLDNPPQFSNAIKQEAGVSDYDDLANKPSLNGITIEGDKTNPEYGITNTIKAALNTTISGYVVPLLTVEQVTDAYNFINSGTLVIVEDATEIQRFVVKQSDALNDELAIDLAFYDTGIVTYLILNDQVEITFSEYEKLNPVNKTSEMTQLVGKDIDGKLYTSPSAPGTSDHTLLINRDADNQHPISSIVGLQTALDEKEDATNKVTTISSSSTDTQYPSAKAVHTALDGLKATAQTITIAVADWSGGTTCTKSVTGVTATNIVIVDTSDGSVECTGQGAGTLTFTTTSTPTSAVTVKVVIL